jgi:hypothetical protein
MPDIHSLQYVPAIENSSSLARRHHTALPAAGALLPPPACCTAATFWPAYVKNAKKCVQNLESKAGLCDICALKTQYPRSSACRQSLRFPGLALPDVTAGGRLRLIHFPIRFSTSDPRGALLT